MRSDHVQVRICVIRFTEGGIGLTHNPQPRDELPIRGGCRSRGPYTILPVHLSPRALYGLTFRSSLIRFCLPLPHLRHRNIADGITGQ